MCGYPHKKNLEVAHRQISALRIIGCDCMLLRTVDLLPVNEKVVLDCVD